MLKLLGINAVFLLVGLVLVELLFGSWFRSNPALYMPCNDTWKFTQSLYEAPTPQVEYHKDAFCMRGNYTDLKDVDILTVGGSTTDQRYLSQGNTWQQRMADVLAKESYPVQVANAGVDGQSTVGHIWNFENWFNRLEGLKPKIIIFYVGINDSLTLDKDTDWQKADDLKDIIKARSALYRVYRVVDGAIKAYDSHVGHQRIDVTQAATTSIPTYEASPEFEKKMQALSGRVKHLAAKAREMGAVPVFVTQKRLTYWQDEAGNWVGVSTLFPGPDGGDINGLDYRYIDRAVADAILKGCEDVQAICVDLAKTLPLTFEDVYDYLHATPAGAEKLGNAMARALLGSSAISVLP